MFIYYFLLSLSTCDTYLFLVFYFFHPLKYFYNTLTIVFVVFLCCLSNKFFFFSNIYNFLLFKRIYGFISRFFNIPANNKMLSFKSKSSVFYSMFFYGFWLSGNNYFSWFLNSVIFQEIFL